MTKSPVSVFVPAPIAHPGTVADNAARAAGFAAGWAEATRLAEEEADTARERERVDHERRQAVRDAQVRAAVARLEAAAHAAEARLVPVVDRLESDVHDVALRIAQAVLQCELSNGERSARGILARALALPSGVKPTVIRMHPEDIAEVRAVVDGGEVALPAGIEFVADATLHRGDAVSEHADGELDARLSTAFARVQAVLDGDA